MEEKKRLPNCTIKFWLRVSKIKKMLLEGKKIYEMAKVLGVHRKTVDRDFGRWRKTADFEAWMSQNFQ